MPFLTIRTHQIGSERFSRPVGPRGEFFAFDYQVSHDPTCEAVGVRLGSELAKVGLPDYWDDIQAGVSGGIVEAAVRGAKMCCTCLYILGTKDSPVDTSPAVVQWRLASFAQSHIVERATAIEPLHPAWLTSDVIALAKGIRADAATDRYPILSDALRDADCEDPLIHDHLQLCPDHGPSCWVVEMILSQTRTAGA